MRTLYLHWKLVNKNTEFSYFELTLNNETLLSLQYHIATETAKIDCIDCRRNFHIIKSGFLLTTVVLQNEYGIDIGHLNHEFWINNGGTVYLYDDKFHFTVNEDKGLTVTIYQKSRKDPLAICEMPLSNNGSAIQHTIYTGLVIALCWFILHSSQRNKKSVTNQKSIQPDNRLVIAH
jgi:hypothetical protein